MIKAVHCLHQNPMTCGVSRFSQALARRLGVPCVGLTDETWPGLFSLKLSELPPDAFDWFGTDGSDVFLHDWDTTLGPVAVRNARRVFAGNPDIAKSARVYRPTAVDAFCPSMVEGNPTRGAYRVLVFGMAHKLLLPHFEALKAQLDAEREDYTVELSTAVHEGSPWDVALTESTTAMRAIFGDRLRVLGFLGDDALAKELQDVDAVAAFYQPALRANNTTYWAAVEAGKRIFTNRDAYSQKDGDPPASWDRLLEIIRA